MNREKPKVTLVGEDGKAFAILAACTREARKAGWTPEEIKAFQEKALRSGSYDLLLGLVMERFDVS